MTINTKPYNPADLLKNDEIIMSVINDALADGDPKIIATALKHVITAKGMSITEVAKDIKVSRTSLYKTLSGDRAPLFSTIMDIMSACGLTIIAKTVDSKNINHARQLSD